MRLKRLTRAPAGLLLCIGLLAVTSRWATGVPFQPPNEKAVVHGNVMARGGMIVIGPPKSNYSVESMGGRAANGGDRRLSDGHNAIVPKSAEPTVSIGEAARSHRQRALYGFPYPILMLGLMAFLFLLLGLCIRE